MINIRSCTSNRELRISRTSDSYLLAKLIGFPVSAKVEVCVEPGNAVAFQAFLVTWASAVGHGLAQESGSRLKEI